MFKSLLTPKLVMRDGMLIRRSGLFYREQICVADICKVTAVNKDSVTHDELVVVVHDDAGPKVWMSEFDACFKDVFETLQQLLPGMSAADDVILSKPFSSSTAVLWRKRNDE